MKPTTQQQNVLLDVLDNMDRMLRTIADAVIGLEIMLEDIKDDMSFIEAYRELNNEWFSIHEQLINAGVEV